MSKRNDYLLKGLHVLAWIIFLGLCIEAGGIIFNTVYAFFKPVVAEHFWNKSDFSQLYAYDKGYFLAQLVLISIVTVMKAMIFYLIIKLFYDKKLNLAKPFNSTVTGTVSNIAYLCAGAGLFSIWGTNYLSWIKAKGISMPDVHLLRIDSGDVWLFMAVVLIVIAEILKKGIELQNENDLTV